MQHTLTSIRALTPLPPFLGFLVCLVYQQFSVDKTSYKLSMPEKKTERKRKHSERFHNQTNHPTKWIDEIIYRLTYLSQ
jgi:hypothetical protein